MIEKMNNKSENLIRIKPLEISFVKKDFVKNLETNYEQYLTEFINSSRFVTDNGNKKFRIIKKQAHGEYDITNDVYSLDFKLLIDNKTIENMYYYNENISVDRNGVVIYSASKKNGIYKNYILINILKSLSKEDIEKISKSPKNQLDEFQKLVKDYIDNIRKNKNILYFVPYNLYFENKVMNNDILDLLVERLSEGLKGFLEYRISHIEKKDTYIGFISNKNIIFLKYDCKLKVYDKVPISESILFSRIKDLNFFN